MRKLQALLGVCTVLAVGVWAASAVADPSVVPLCPSAGTALSGSYHNLTITGNAYVANDASTTLTVTGNLKLAPGACLDAFSMGTVNVSGNVLVGSGATLALGCTLASTPPPTPCTGTTSDTVGGNIVADHANTMYLDGDTIRGNVISTGGGPGPTLDPYVNFPIKDNEIFGNLIVQGWQGAWFGVLRNVVHGNVEIVNNTGANPDSTEVTANTVSGNLICQGNSPGAQIGDAAPVPNTVSGHKIGECAGL